MTDAGLLDAAPKAMRPADEVRREMDGVSARLKPYEDREEESDREDSALDDAEEALDDREDDAEIEAQRRSAWPSPCAERPPVAGDRVQASLIFLDHLEKDRIRPPER